MFNIVMIVIAVPALIFYQFYYSDDDNKYVRVTGTLMWAFILALNLSINLADKGVFGKPRSLSETSIYLVVDVVPNDDNSTFVILRDASDKNIPIKFPTKLQKDLVNQFCKLTGEDEKTYNLVPVK